MTRALVDPWSSAMVFPFCTLSWASQSAAIQALDIKAGSESAVLA